MSVISPTNNSYEDDFHIWMSNIVPALYDNCRKTVLMYDGNIIVGYFRFHLDYNSQSLLMEDIQIKSEYQGSGIFTSFYKWLISDLPRNTLIVEAYANKQNCKSIAILEHLGLERVGENKSGNSYHYKGHYAFILDKYS